MRATTRAMYRKRDEAELVQLVTRVPASLREQIRKAAKRGEVSAAAWVAEAIQHALKQASSK